METTKMNGNHKSDNQPQEEIDLETIQAAIDMWCNRDIDNRSATFFSFNLLGCRSAKVVFSNGDVSVNLDTQEKIDLFVADMFTFDTENEIIFHYYGGDHQPAHLALFK